MIGVRLVYVGRDDLPLLALMYVGIAVLLGLPLAGMCERIG